MTDKKQAVDFSSLTTKEMHLVTLMATHQGDTNVDWEAISTTLGHKTTKVTKDAWRPLKKKLTTIAEQSGIASTASTAGSDTTPKGSAAPSTPKKTTTPRKNPARATKKPVKGDKLSNEGIKAEHDSEVDEDLSEFDEDVHQI